MEKIPQRILRNQSGAILRRAETGESFVITVNQRPVAILGPYEARQWVPAEQVRAMLSTPTDPTVLKDLRASGLDHDLDDPWER